MYDYIIIAINYIVFHRIKAIQYIFIVNIFYTCKSFLTRQNTYPRQGSGLDDRYYI